MHGCPCGYFGDPTRECRRTPAIIQRYLGKIGGPLLDRIDIQIEVRAVPYKELRAGEESESSGGMRERVVQAREVQLERGHSNARMPSRLIRKQCAWMSRHLAEAVQYPEPGQELPGISANRHILVVPNGLRISRIS